MVYVHMPWQKPTFYTVFDRHEREIGIASYLRINPSVGSIEVGWISMSPLMQRTVMSAEAMYLMMSHVFDDLGYRAAMSGSVTASTRHPAPRPSAWAFDLKAYSANAPTIKAATETPLGSL